MRRCGLRCGLSGAYVVTRVVYECVIEIASHAGSLRVRDRYNFPIISDPPTAEPHAARPRPSADRHSR